MQVIVKTTSTPVAPKSEFGRFVLADVKKGDAAHAFRLSMIASAVLEGYKGNPNGLIEATAAAQGRSTIARAYQAGLSSLPAITKLAYVGAWARTENAGIRKQAHDLTDEATGLFGAAFDAVFTEEKAKAKAKRDMAREAAEQGLKEKEAAAQGEPSDAAEAIEAALAAAAGLEQAVDIGAAVEAVVMAVQQGMLAADEVVLLRAALAAYDDSNTNTPDLLTRTPVLLMAQA
jgi:hypothetical protein